MTNSHDKTPVLPGPQDGPHRMGTTVIACPNIQPGQLQHSGLSLLAEVGIR